MLTEYCPAWHDHSFECKAQVTVGTAACRFAIIVSADKLVVLAKAVVEVAAGTAAADARAEGTMAEAGGLEGGVTEGVEVAAWSEKLGAAVLAKAV